MSFQYDALCLIANFTQKWKPCRDGTITFLRRVWYHKSVEKLREHTIEVERLGPRTTTSLSQKKTVEHPGYDLKRMYLVKREDVILHDGAKAVFMRLVMEYAVGNAKPDYWVFYTAVIPEDIQTFPQETRHLWVTRSKMGSPPQDADFEPFEDEFKFAAVT